MRHRFVIAALALSAGAIQPQEHRGEDTTPAATGLPDQRKLMLVLRLCEVGSIGAGRSIRVIWEGRCACPMFWYAGSAAGDFAVAWLVSLSGVSRAWSQS